MCVLYICVYRLFLFLLPPLKSMTYRLDSETALPKVALQTKKPPEGGHIFDVRSLTSIWVDQRKRLTVSILDDVRSQIEHGILLILFSRRDQRIAQ